MADPNCPTCSGCGSVVVTKVEYDKDGGEIWYPQAEPCPDC